MLLYQNNACALQQDINTSARRLQSDRSPGCGTPEAIGEPSMATTEATSIARSRAAWEGGGEAFFTTACWSQKRGEAAAALEEVGVVGLHETIL